MAEKASSLEQFLSPPWMKDAACKGTNPDPYFSRDNIDKVSAIKVCKTCPVRGDCLDYALVFDLDGIWGGLTDLQRNRMYSEESRIWLREEYFEETA